MGEIYMMPHQMFGMEIEHNHSHLHPNSYIVLGNPVDFPNPSIYPVMSASENTANFNLSQFTEHHDNSVFYGNQYNQQQQQQQQPPVSNIELGSVGPSNFYHSYMVFSSSSRIFPIPVTNGSADSIPSSSNLSVMRVDMDEYGRNFHFIDNVREPCKRKNAEYLNCYYVNGIPNPSSSSLNLSLNSGQQNWDESFELGVNMMDAPNFTLPEYRGGLLPLTEGSQRSVRSRRNVTSFQMESPAFLHHNHLFQGSYVGPSFQPAGSTWVEQFEINGGDGGTWNYMPAISYLQGRNLGGGSQEIENMGSQGHQEPSSSRNSAILFHPPPLYTQQQQLPPMQGMQGHNYNHLQVPTPSYGHPMNNHLHINPSRDSLDSVSRIPIPFSFSAADQIYWPHRRLPQADPEVGDGHMRILYPEDIAALEFSGFHGAGDFSDLHRDMRMDIDSMSYEELLALEERIGDVNTGLSEDSILKNLKTRIYSSTASSLSSLSNQSSDIAPENGTCIICQVEFEENERIGSLDCGHYYHADCIKQWLLVKNLCPICKTSALATARRREV